MLQRSCKEAGTPSGSRADLAWARENNAYRVFLPCLLLILNERMLHHPQFTNESEQCHLKK